VIPLQNQSQQHIGFLLHSGLPLDFMSKVGDWEGECIFMALPAKSELFDDPAFAVLEGHKHAGEHRLAVTNDGETLSFLATAPTGAQLFVRLPKSPTGTWGTRAIETETLVGHAARVSNQSARNDA
jgi:hypothetical protein